MRDAGKKVSKVPDHIREIIMMAIRSPRVTSRTEWAGLTFLLALITQTR